MSAARFDPYVLLQALDAERVAYVVVGGFARVVQGSGERTAGLDIVPSLREDNLRRLARAVERTGGAVDAEQVAAGEPVAADTDAGRLAIVPTPWGTRGYNDLRIRANRENLGRRTRPQIASVADLTRMLEASTRGDDRERLSRLRRMMDIEHRLARSRGRSLER